MCSNTGSCQRQYATKTFFKEVDEAFSNHNKMRELTRQIGPLAIAGGQQAMKVVRQPASQWGLAPARIGMIGFSAGGRVTVGVALEHDAESRPNFAAPIYGALWEDLAVPADAPPLFIALANDDELAVDPGVALYCAWRAPGQSVELHIYAQGGHGFGMRKQGLLVCACCGYAYYGKPISPSARKGHPRKYAYYRCIGSDAYRFGGVRLCWNKQLRTDLVDEAVWNEVCKLLEDPSRLEQEYRPISIPKVCTIVGGVVALVLALVSAAVIVPVKRVR